MNQFIYLIVPKLQIPTAIQCERSTLLLFRKFLYHGKPECQCVTEWINLFELSILFEIESLENQCIQAFQTNNFPREFSN